METVWLIIIFIVVMSLYGISMWRRGGFEKFILGYTETPPKNSPKYIRTPKHNWSVNPTGYLKVLVMGNGVNSLIDGNIILIQKSSQYKSTDIVLIDLGRIYILREVEKSEKEGIRCGEELYFPNQILGVAKYVSQK